MSLTRKVAHNTIIQIAGKIVSTMLGLVALGMMARYLGEKSDQFGWYITTVSFLQFVGILTDFGMTPVTAQMMSEPEYDKKKLLNNLLGFRFFSSLIVFVLAPLIALFFPYPIEVKIAMAFTSLSFLAIAVNQVLVGYYQTELKMQIQVIGDILSRVFLVIGVWAVIMNRGSFYSLMLVITMASVIFTFILWFLVFKETKVKLSCDKKMWAVIIKKMWPIALSISFNVLYLKGDIILLSLFRSQNEVGLYGAPYRVLDLVTQTAMMLMGILLPLLAFSWSRNLKEDFIKRYQKTFDYMMLLGLPLSVGSIILADKIMVLVAGKDFLASGPILQILSLAVFGIYLGAIYGHTAVAINKQKQTIWIYLSDAIITFIGYLIFIPKYGMLGAAWMTVFSELYAGIMLFFTVKYYSKVKLQINNFAKILFSSLVMGGVLFLFRSLHVLILILVGILVYGFFVLGFGVVTGEIVKEIVRKENT